MFYTGIVEDRNDPLELGRYRVRIFGVHSHDLNDVPTEALPWANVLQPATSAGINGTGQTPKLVVGSNVVCIFFDEDLQRPIIMGSIGGYGVESHLIFNGVEVPNDNNSFGFTAKTSTGYKHQSTLPRAARSGAIDNPEASIKVEGGAAGFAEPEDLRSRRRYPYNDVRQSESGHIEEWDNTPGNERIRTQHKTGTMQEMRPDGSVHNKIVGDRYTIIAAGDNVYVEGVCNIHLNSDVNMYVGGNYTLNVAGDYELNVKGDKYENVVGDVTHNTEGFKQEMAGDDITLSSAGNISLGGSGDVKFNTNGDLSLEALGNLNLGSNTDLNILSRGNTMLASTGNINLAATGSAWFNVDGTFRMNSGGAMNVGSTGAMSVGSASGVRLTGSTVDINDGGSAPAVVATNIEIDEFESPDFESPGVEFETPVVVSVEPDLETFSTQYGTLSRSEYEAYVSNAGTRANINHDRNASFDVHNSKPSSGSNHVGGTSGVDPSTYQAKGGIAGLLEFIGKGEGSYDAANNGTVGNNIVGSTMMWKHPDGRKLSELTIGEIIELQKGERKTGRSLFAVGRYQIIPNTMRSLAFPRSGLSIDDVFSPENQDTMGIALLINGQRPLLAAYLKGESDDIFAAQMDFAKEWASVPRPDTGASYYGNGNKSSHSVAEVQEALRSARAEFTNQTEEKVNENIQSNVQYDEFGDPIPKNPPPVNSNSGVQ